MTNEDLLNDLKQFIDAKIDGAEQRLDTRIDNVRQELKADIKHVDEKLDKVQLAVADTLTKAVEAVDVTKEVGKHDEDLQDHEHRLTRLEHRPA